MTALRDTYPPLFHGIESLKAMLKAIIGHLIHRHRDPTSAGSRHLRIGGNIAIPKYAVNALLAAFYQSD
jgi:hypothetical protein